MLCAKLPINHSKIIIATDFAYIGSANFSFGSNNNYESGVIFKNKEIITEITKYYCEELLDKSEFTNVPECFDPFYFLPRVLNAVEKLNNIDRKDELYSDTKHEMAELRFLDDLEENLEALGYPVPANFDWWELYMNLYEEKHVPVFVFHKFKNYLHELSPYLANVTNFIKEQYKSIGRNALLKKIGVIE